MPACLGKLDRDIPAAEPKLKANPNAAIKIGSISANAVSIPLRASIKMPEKTSTLTPTRKARWLFRLM